MSAAIGRQHGLKSHGNLPRPPYAKHLITLDDSRVTSSEVRATSMFSLRSIATVGGMTLVSRILGFVREVMIAGILGTGPIAEAFIVAMRLPNLLRQMFAEGAFSAAFVPVFTRHLADRGMSGARIFAEQVLALLLVVLLVMTVCGRADHALAHPYLRAGLRCVPG